MSYIKLFTTELKNKGLSLFDKAVYGSLQTKFQYHGNKEFYTFESYIADELEISERTVKRSIKKLYEVGLITITRRYHKQLKQAINYYNLDVDSTIDEDLISDVITGEKEKYTDIEDKARENENTSDINAIITEGTDDTDNTEDIEDMENTETNNSIFLPLNFNDLEIKTDNERIAEAIEENYNVTPNEYFKEINSIRDIKFSMLEDLGSKTDIKDLQKVLDYIKEVRNIA